VKKVIGISPDIESLMAEYKPKGQLEHTALINTEVFRRKSCKGKSSC